MCACVIFRFICYVRFLLLFFQDPAEVKLRRWFSWFFGFKRLDERWTTQLKSCKQVLRLRGAKLETSEQDGLGNVSVLMLFLTLWFVNHFVF